MGKILCATRGGEASIRTQNAAINKARETASELIFFYVYDVEFMAHAKYALRSDVVTDEMERMAEFLMSMAVERAKEQGINAHYTIRQGRFVDELAAAAEEEQATLVILGRPEEENVFKLEHLRELTERLQTETGIPFCIMPDHLTDQSI
ncbi:MAG: universal stress protein [Anaerolineae bacterium]|nr:universal stress protein [Anaerolineae bacterium]